MRWLRVDEVCPDLDEFGWNEHTGGIISTALLRLKTTAVAPTLSAIEQRDSSWKVYARKDECEPDILQH